MENQEAGNVPNQTPMPEVSKSSDKIFSMIGKIVLGILIIGGLVFGGYYFGVRNQKPAPQNVPVIPMATPSPTTTPPPASPTPVVQQPTPSVWSKGETFTGNAPFVTFTTYLMKGWTEKKETVGTGFKVTISNGSYQIVISQAPGGAAQCTYPGQTAGPMSAPFNQPTDVPGFPDTNRNFRRATQPGGPTGTYLFCQQKSGTWSMPTDYGYISYVVPASPSSEMLGQMDATIGMLR